MTPWTWLLVIIGALVAAPIVIGILKLIFAVVMFGFAFSMGKLANWLERRGLAKMTPEEQREYRRMQSGQAALDRIKKRWNVQ